MIGTRTLHAVNLCMCTRSVLQVCVCVCVFVCLCVCVLVIDFSVGSVSKTGKYPDDQGVVTFGTACVTLVP